MGRAASESAAREKILKAVIAMRRSSNVYAYQLTHLKVVIDWDCATGWTDGVSLGFNPDWLNSLSVSQVRTFLAHEVEHVEQGLPWRMARYPADWHPYLNEGADYGINARLVAAGYEPIPNWLLDDQYANRSAEEIAAELYRNRDDEQQEQQDGEGGEGGDDDSAGGDEDQEAAENTPETAAGSETNDDTPQEGAEGSGKGAEGGDENSAGGEGGGSGAEGADDSSSDSGEGGEGGDDGPTNSKSSSVSGEGRGNNATGGVRPFPVDPTDDRSEESQLNDGYQRMRETMANGVRYAESNGGLNDADRLKYQDILDPERSYADILRDLVDEVFADDYSYDVPDESYWQRRCIVPSLYNERQRLVVFVVDTSGSMNMDAFSTASADVKGICDDLNATLAVVYCDSRVRGMQMLEAGQYEELKPVGGGGTDFRPAFEFCETMDVQPSVILYFSDMMCQRYKFPAQEPSAPTYFIRWGSFNHPDLPSWATVINMEGGNRG